MDERHGDVTLKHRPEQDFGYARHVWAVMIGGEQRGWVVRPDGIGADHEAWSMHRLPSRRATVGKTGLLGKAEGVVPEDQRRDLARRFVAAHARGMLPTKMEVEAARPARTAPPPKRTRDISMRAALGGIRVSESRKSRVDEEGRPLPGIGYIP